MALLKRLNTIVLRWSEEKRGFRGVLNRAIMMPREASFSRKAIRMIAVDCRVSSQDINFAA